MGAKMKTILLFLLLTAVQLTAADQYILLGWNDLGMHCANKDFQNLCILPPYNNLTTQVIRKGDQSRFPQLMATNLHVTYEVPGNTYSVGKTNFWSYEDKLFGVQLQDNVGLTGKGLTGEMDPHLDYFEAVGIPATPYNDADLLHESPYQLALMKVYDAQNNLLATTQNVIPVSNEINCVSSGCHSNETDILNEHEKEGGFNPANRPILCAECHASAALSKPGKAGMPSLSQAVHGKHRDLTNDCYRCHPGTNTKCLRDIMFSKGLKCQDCHGSVANVATTIQNGRRPWLDEPKCGASSCHGPNFSEQPNTLFRMSRGHGNLYCSACHGSPHAIVPTIEANDNLQNLTLQGQSGVLKDCKVCHGITPSGNGPHNITVPVELVSFSAMPQNNSIRLTWAVTMMFDLYGFEIQRTQGNEEFKIIGFISAGSNSWDIDNYLFEDSDVLAGETYVYRLRMIDRDGSFTLSDSRSVSTSIPQKHKLLASYPNPFNSQTRIRFELSSQEDVQLLIYDMNGRLVRRLVEKQFSAGMHEIAWDGLSEYGRTTPSGIYMVRMTISQSSFEQKLAMLK
jgi:hypothetical protein